MFVAVKCKSYLISPVDIIFSAMSSYIFLGIFVMTSQFTELFLLRDKKTTEETDCIREIMHSIVDRSIDQFKLKNIITVADAERYFVIIY